MAGTIVVDRIESDGSYASTINVASKVNFAAGMQIGGQDTAFSGVRNHIINGDFKVWQRGTSFSYSTFGGAPYCVDRFWFYNGGGATSGNVERSTDVPDNQGFLYSLFNNTNATMSSGTNVELIGQGSAAPFIVGQTYTLSFWVKGSTPSSNIVMYINWADAHATGSNRKSAVANYPTFSVTTSWTRVVIPFTINSSPNATSRILDLEYNQSSGMKITGMQLEAGSVATPFEYRSYGQELALCQRYYFREVGSDGEYCYFANGGAYSTTQGRFMKQYPVPMRAKPTFTVTGTSYVDGVNFVSLSSLNLEYANSTVARLGYTSSSTGNGAGQSVFLAQNTNGSISISFSAEL